MRTKQPHRITTAAVVSLLAVGTALAMPTAAADNKRLNDAVVVNVGTIKYKAGCTDKMKTDPQLRLAAQWHANDVLRNRNLNGDIGSDGSTPQDRAHAAGYRGQVSQTIAINPALAINNMEVLRQWYYNPAYMALIEDCAKTQIGVWSENSFDRSVLVAVYGAPE